MEPQKLQKGKVIRQWLEIALGALTVILGILFIVQCQILYHTNKEAMGGHPYTYDAIWKAFAPILAVVVVFGVLLIANGVLSIIFPETGRWRFQRSNQDTLSLLESRLPKDAPEGCESVYSSIKKEQKTRKIAYYISLGLCLVCIFMISCYMFNAKNFSHTESEALIEEAISCMEHVLPFVIIGFACVFISFGIGEISAKRELNYVKTALKSAKGGIKPEPKKGLDKTGIWLIRGLVLVVAIAFIAGGIFNGGAQEMLHKAVNLCSECLGLG